MHDLWKPFFQNTSPIFEHISPYAQTFDDFSNWPNLNDYNNLLKKIHANPRSKNKAALSFIPQETNPISVDEEYEVRIYKTGNIQTRLNNWHDFFQVMIWCRFLETKKIINQLHAQAIINRNKSSNNSQRSAVENTLTLFDECGAILVSSNKFLIDLIRGHSWTQLFLNNREKFNNELQCFVFGHALYEKALNPYLGMTAHSIIIEVEKPFFSLTPDEQCRILDEQLCCYFSSLEKINTQLLQPFPILGVPGWDKDNIKPAYYDNKDYFREKRLKI